MSSKKVFSKGSSTPSTPLEQATLYVEYYRQVELAMASRRPPPPPPPPASSSRKSGAKSKSTSRSGTSRKSSAAPAAVAVAVASSKSGSSKPKPWWRRPWLIFWLLLLLAIIAAALALGLYFGLKDDDDDDGQQHKALDFPSGDLAVNKAGMQQEGAFYTESSDYGATGKVFSWSQGGPGLGATGASTDNVDVLINISSVQQPIDGFGAALTDSSCWLLYQLKLNNETNYNETMDYFFNNRTGMSTIRIPIGASDFSNQGTYTYAEQNATEEAVQSGNYKNIPGPLDGFSIAKAQAYILPVILDAIARKPDLKIWFSCWSPPAWMKTSDDTNGGQLIYGEEELYAEYLAKSVQAYAYAGVSTYAMTMQNEPSTGTTNYPSNWMSPASQAIVAACLRIKLGAMGYGNVKLFAHDDNWSGWENAVAAIQANTTVFDGVAWHCYNGAADAIDNFNAALGYSTEWHLTECTTTDDSKDQWWSTQFWFKNFFFGSLNRGARSFMAWNLVLDKNNKPYISTAPCKDCLGSFKITSPSSHLDPAVQASNVQFITTYHFASATSNLAYFGGGQSYMVTTTLATSQQKCITGLSAFAAPWNGSDYSQSPMKRIGLVVENDCGSDATLSVGVQPQGRVGTFKFKAGVTTLIFNT